MDFACYRVGIKPFVAFCHIFGRYVVHIGIEVVQAVGFGDKAVVAGGGEHGFAGFAFLVGIGVDDEHIRLRMGFAVGKCGLLAGLVLVMGGGKLFKIKMVIALRIGERLVVVYIDNMGLGVVLLELGDELGGVGGFACTFVPA